MNDYSTTEKTYMLICGLLILSCVIYVTHIAWEHRVINQEWNKTFTTPQEFWQIEKKK